MAILSPRFQHELAHRLSDAPSIAGKQPLFDSRSTRTASSSIQSKPIALPHPPRPPTPGPLRPSPLPPHPPVLTPPPSPRHHLFQQSGSGNSGPQHQLPYPNPPPSPGPRRPGPVGPRPNVPTPPPSPRRSVTASTIVDINYSVP